MKKLALFVAVLSAVCLSPRVFAAGSVARQLSTAIAVTPTITAGAYTTGQQLGGVQTLTNVSVDSRTGANLSDVFIVDASKQSLPMDILIFGESPTLTSVDNGAFALSAANAAKAIAIVTVVAGDWKTSSAQAFANVANLGRVVIPAASGVVTGTSPKTLYAVAVARGSATFTATTALKFIYKFLQF